MKLTNDQIKALTETISNKVKEAKRLEAEVELKKVKASTEYKKIVEIQEEYDSLEEKIEKVSKQLRDLRDKFTEKYENFSMDYENHIYIKNTQFDSKSIYNELVLSSIDKTEVKDLNKFIDEMVKKFTK